MGTTSRFGFVYPDDSSSMSDITTYLNNNWAKIESNIAAPSVASIPDQDFTYPLGSRVYHTGLKSVFINIGSDANWGVLWRPVQTKYGPWLRPGPVANPSACLFDPTNYKIDDAVDPFQYRLTNQGLIQFRGSVRRVSGVFPDYGAGNPAFQLFNIFPDPITPPLYNLFEPAPYTVNASTTNIQKAQWVVRSDGVNNGLTFVRVWNPNNTVFALYFSGIEYPIAHEVYA